MSDVKCCSLDASAVPWLRRSAGLRGRRSDGPPLGARGLSGGSRDGPREVAEACAAPGRRSGRREARTSPTSARASRSPGPGFINLTLSPAFLATRGERARARPRGSGCRRRSAATEVDPRLLGAERREGDARRPPALDDHRRRARPHPRILGPRGRAAEPRRRLGHAVRHADRAPRRPRPGRNGRLELRRQRAQRVLSQRAREVRQRSRHSPSARAGASCCCRPETRTR